MDGQVKEKAKDGKEVAWKEATKRAEYDQRQREKRRAKREAKLITKEFAGGDEAVERLAKHHTTKLREKRATLVEQGMLKPPPEVRDEPEREEVEESEEERRSREILQHFQKKQKDPAASREQPATSGGTPRPVGKGASTNLGAMGLLRKKGQKKAAAGGMGIMEKAMKKKEKGQVGAAAPGVPRAGLELGPEL